MSLSLITICFEARRYTRDLLKGRRAPFAKSYMVGREGKRTHNRTMLPSPKNQCSCRLQGSSENRALKGAGLLIFSRSFAAIFFMRIVTTRASREPRRVPYLHHKRSSSTKICTVQNRNQIEDGNGNAEVTGSNPVEA